MKNKNKIASWVGAAGSTVWIILSFASKGKIPGGAQGAVGGYIAGYVLARIVLAFIPLKNSMHQVQIRQSSTDSEINSFDRMFDLEQKKLLHSIKKCARCEAEVLYVDHKFCSNCGAPLE
jgi:hypothetical protein